MPCRPVAYLAAVASLDRRKVSHNLENLGSQAHGLALVLADSPRVDADCNVSTGVRGRLTRIPCSEDCSPHSVSLTLGFKTRHCVRVIDGVVMKQYSQPQQSNKRVARSGH